MKHFNIFCLLFLITTLSTCVGKNTYSLRDSGLGTGLVFYIDPAGAKLLPEGKTYLEAAPSDQSVDAMWGVYGTSTDATLTDVGSGQANTDKIVATQGTGSYAAQLCNDLVLGGYSDWFLPSKDELDKMYVNLHKGTDEYGVIYEPVGAFTTGGGTADGYWSSSGGWVDMAWAQFFDVGEQLGVTYGSINTEHVRCVRAF